MKEAFILLCAIALSQLCGAAEDRWMSSSAYAKDCSPILDSTLTVQSEGEIVDAVLIFITEESYDPSLYLHSMRTLQDVAVNNYNMLLNIAVVPVDLIGASAPLTLGERLTCLADNSSKTGDLLLSDYVPLVLFGGHGHASEILALELAADYGDGVVLLTNGPSKPPGFALCGYLDVLLPKSPATAQVDRALPLLDHDLIVDETPTYWIESSITQPLNVMDISTEISEKAYGMMSDSVKAYIGVMMANRISYSGMESKLAKERMADAVDMAMTLVDYYMSVTEQAAVEKFVKWTQKKIARVGGSLPPLAVDNIIVTYYGDKKGAFIVEDIEHFRKATPSVDPFGHVQIHAYKGLSMHSKLKSEENSGNSPIGISHDLALKLLAGKSGARGNRHRMAKRSGDRFVVSQESVVKSINELVLQRCMSKVSAKHIARFNLTQVAFQFGADVVCSSEQEWLNTPIQFDIESLHDGVVVMHVTSPVFYTTVYDVHQPSVENSYTYMKPMSPGQCLEILLVGALKVQRNEAPDTPEVDDWMDFFNS